MSIFIFQLFSFYSIASFFFFLFYQKLFTINNTISLLCFVIWWLLKNHGVFISNEINILKNFLSFTFIFFYVLSALIIYIAGVGNNSKFEFSPNSTPVFPVNHCGVLVTWSISVWLEQDNTQMIKFMPFWSVFP